MNIWRSDERLTIKEIKQLELTIAFDTNDSTFGWKSYQNALAIYYMSQGELFNNS
jgi:hypothetical protein